jgi:hypothetical protein
MKRLISIFALTTALSGCAWFNVSTATNTTASVLQATSTSIEAAQSTAVLYYRFEQEKALQDGLREGLGKEQMRAKISELRLRWTPTWMLFEEARVAYNELVDLVKLVGEGKAKDQDLAPAYSKLQQKLSQAEFALSSARGDHP